MTIKVIKTESTLTPDQQAFVAEVRGILDRALRGEVVGMFGLVTAVDEGFPLHEPAIFGNPGDVDALCRRLGHLQVIADGLDGTSWLDDDDEGEE